MTFGSGWSQSGTVTTTAGYSWSAAPSTLYREYDVEEEYGKWYYSCTWEYDFYPEGPSGGVQSPSISYQGKWNSTYCSRVDPGTWKREDSGLNTYSLSGGVKSSSIIGINLSVKTDYSTSASSYKKTAYSMTTWNNLCGNNAKPGKAGRITDIGHNAP